MFKLFIRLNSLFLSPSLFLSLSQCPWRRPFLANPSPLFYSIRILQVSHGIESRIDDYGSCDVDPPPYLALARGALVLPGAAAIVDDAAVTARPRNRERGAVRWHLSTTGIVLATRATVALLGHGI